MKGLGVSFGALKAVHDLTFDAQRGQVTAIIGPNGAGKSTAFNLISGAITPKFGQVKFEGQIVTGFSPDKMLAVGLSRSFQITNLFFDLSVHENLRLAGQYLERGRGWWSPVQKSQTALARADELLSQFGLISKANDLAGAPLAWRAAQVGNCCRTGFQAQHDITGRAHSRHESC